ncbi:MAG: FecR family protein [Dehalococcoidales bacterium]|nr:FecR family protein [Dehalococcoidales bacterium]
MKAHTSTWLKAQVDMKLEPGDILKTANNSWAMITFFEGSTIELEPGTELSIIGLNITTDTGATHIELGQQIGRTVSRVKKLTDTASSYEVKTPTSVGAVRGSIMLVEVVEDGTTAVGNEEGTIEVIAQGEKVKIPVGTQSKVERGKTPDPPKNGLPFAPSRGDKVKDKEPDQNKDKGQGKGQDQQGQGQGQEQGQGKEPDQNKDKGQGKEPEQNKEPDQNKDKGQGKEPDHGQGQGKNK